MHNNSSLKGKSINNKKGISISRNSQKYLERLNINDSTQINVLIQDITKEMDESDKI